MTAVEQPRLSPDESSAPRRSNILILWSSSDRGVRSVGYTLETILTRPPFDLTVEMVDLSESLANRSLLQRLAIKMGSPIDANTFADLAWPDVENRLKQMHQTFEVLVAMDSIAATAADLWRQRGLLKAPVVGITSSLGFDPYWAASGVDRLSVADEIQAEQAMSLGLPAEVLVPMGIPVCSSFASPNPDEKEQLRRKYGMTIDQPVILFVTDGLSSDQISSAFFQLSLLADKVTLLCDVARDEETAELLRRRARMAEIKAQMFGKVEEAGELWAAATLVVARPMTYVEQRVLALRLPLICLMPQTLVESEVAKTYVTRQIGRTVSALPTLAAEIELQLAPAALNVANQNLRSISRRSACYDLARMIAQVKANAAQILWENTQRKTPSTKEGKIDTSRAGSTVQTSCQGPLETIGVTSSSDEVPEVVSNDSEEEQVLMESEVTQQVMEHQQEAERWRRWSQLAGDRGEHELQAEAEKRLEQHQVAMHRALDELARLSERRKAKSTNTFRKERLEEAFRQLEVEEALAALKRKTS